MAAAAAPNLDLSLDDMMANRPRNKGNRRGDRRTNGGARRNGNDGTIVLGGGGVARYTGNRENRRNRPYATAAASTMIPATGDIGSKIIVSNLDFNVMEDDLKELFATQVGPLRKVALSFDQNGRSRGIAQVTFSRKSDATKAYERYHNVTLDGRPMLIEIVVTPMQTTTGRLVGAPNQVRNQNSSGGRSHDGGRSRGRNGRAGRSGSGRGNKSPPKTAEDLDAEMSAYMNTAAVEDKTVTAMDEDIAM